MRNAKLKIRDAKCERGKGTKPGGGGEEGGGVERNKCTLSAE